MIVSRLAGLFSKSFIAALGNRAWEERVSLTGHLQPFRLSLVLHQIDEKSMRLEGSGARLTLADGRQRYTEVPC
jgi:hypothetical protein